MAEQFEFCDLSDAVFWGVDLKRATFRDVDLTKGWESETAHGVARLGAFAVAGGKRSAFVRVPDKKVTVILLTNDDSADAKGMANRIVDRLVTAGHH